MCAQVGGSSSSLGPIGGSKRSINAASANPAATCPIEDSRRDSHTRSDPDRPNIACRNPARVTCVVTDPVKIWPTNCTARRTDESSPANTAARADGSTSDMLSSMPAPTDSTAGPAIADTFGPREIAGAIGSPTVFRRRPVTTSCPASLAGSPWEPVGHLDVGRRGSTAMLRRWSVDSREDMPP